MDTFLLKLTGKAETPERIETGHNYHVSLEGSVTSETKTDNEDGTHTYTALFRPVKMDLLDKKGKMLKLKDMRTASQLWRARVWTFWKNKADTTTTDAEFYEKLMNNMIQRAPEIIEMYYQ